MQVCDSEEVRTIKGVLIKDHISMHVEYTPSLAISNLVKRMKGSSLRITLGVVPASEEAVLGKHFWAIGYGAWSTGNVTDKMLNDYHHDVMMSVPLSLTSLGAKKDP